MNHRIIDGQYDSLLHTANVSPTFNADLGLTVRTYLHQVNGTLFSDQWNQRQPIVAWPSEAAFQQFRQEFKVCVERLFNNRMWLVPDTYWGCDVRRGSQATHRPNIKCSVTIQLVDSAPQSHMQVQCVYPAPGAAIRPSMSDATRTGTIGFGDNTQQRVQCGTMQARSAHEFGHYLGLRHVAATNPGCVNGGETVCYCPNSRVGADLMGGGEQIREWHAGPWLQRLRRHLDVECYAVRWRVALDRPLPVTLPAAPPIVNRPSDWPGAVQNAGI